MLAARSGVDRSEEHLDRASARVDHSGILTEDAKKERRDHSVTPLLYGERPKDRPV
jgi:hypothetical protein